MEFITLIFSNFFTWIGFVIILDLCLNFVFNMYQEHKRKRVIMKHGYPPEHCDVDGDFDEEFDEEDN